MLSFIAFLNAIPEIIKLIKAMSRKMDMQTEEDRNQKAEIKKNLGKIAEAIEEHDEKKLNDVFRSL